MHNVGTAVRTESRCTQDHNRVPTVDYLSQIIRGYTLVESIPQNLYSFLIGCVIINDDDHNNNVNNNNKLYLYSTFHTQNALLYIWSIFKARIDEKR